MTRTNLNVTVVCGIVNHQHILLDTDRSRYFYMNWRTFAGYIQKKKKKKKKKKSNLYTIALFIQSYSVQHSETRSLHSTHPLRAVCIYCMATRDQLQLWASASVKGTGRGNYRLCMFDGEGGETISLLGNPHKLRRTCKARESNPSGCEASVLTAELTCCRYSGYFRYSGDLAIFLIWFWRLMWCVRCWASSTTRCINHLPCIWPVQLCNWLPAWEADWCRFRSIYL